MPAGYGRRAFLRRKPPQCLLHILVDCPGARAPGLFISGDPMPIEKQTETIALRLTLRMFTDLSRLAAVEDRSISD